MTRRSFPYGHERIEYEVLFVPGERDRVSIHVRPDGAVQVHAPDGENLERVHRAVLKRARWIRRHVKAARDQRAHVLPRDYVSGESVFYLGRRYQLKVAEASDAGPGVKMLRGKICVAAPSRETAVVRQQMSGWYRQRANEVFERRLGEIADSIPWLEELPEWRLVRMRTQWGSCSPAGAILLNPYLVKAPRPCIDYVICHELCHLHEHNHSPRFYRLLGQLMPDWQPVKARLDGMAELLLNE